MVPNRGAHAPPGVNRGKLGCVRTQGEIGGGVAKAGGEGQLRVEWGCMFKSRVR